VKRSPINRRSKKRITDDATRTALRNEYLAEHPHCEMCRQAPATDIDEIISRGVYPGAQLIVILFQALCRTCHRRKTDYPGWAYRHGYSAHSWDFDYIEDIKRQRVYHDLDCTTDHIERPTDVVGAIV